MTSLGLIESSKHKIIQLLVKDMMDGVKLLADGSSNFRDNVSYDLSDDTDDKINHVTYVDTKDKEHTDPALIYIMKMANIMVSVVHEIDIINDESNDNIVDIYNNRICDQFQDMMYNFTDVLTEINIDTKVDHN